jgi:hypothetical protein
MYMSIRKSFPSSSFPYNKKHCGVEGAEKALSYTHVHKIINVSVLYMEYRLTDFDVDQSFTLPCSVSYLSIHTAVTKPLFPYIKECKDGGRGRRGEKNLFFTHVHKITNAPFLYIKYKVIEVAQSLTLFCFLLPTHTTDTKTV